MSLSGSWVRDQFALVICRYHPWGCIHSTKGFWRSRVGRDGKVACLHVLPKLSPHCQSCVAKELDSSILILLLEMQVLKMNLFSFLDGKVHHCTTHVEKSLCWKCDLRHWPGSPIFLLDFDFNYSCTKRLRDRSLRLLSSLFWTAVMNAAMSERSTLSIFTSCCNSKEMRSQLRWHLRITRCGFARTNQRAFCTDTETCLNSKSDELGFKYFDIVAIFQYLPDVLH